MLFNSSVLPNNLNFKLWNPLIEKVMTDAIYCTGAIINLKKIMGECLIHFFMRTLV